MAIQIEKVDTGRLTMDFFRFGTGRETFIILPGLSVKSVMGSADAVAAQYALLAERFTVYVFDRRSDLPESYSIYDMAEDTAEAITALGLKDVCIFGASQGGMIAQVIAAEHPELVKKLILGSSACHVDIEKGSVIDNWIEMAKVGDRLGLYLDFGQKLYPKDFYEQYRDVLVSIAETVTDDELSRFITIAEGTDGFDVREKLAGVRCPVLILGAADDAVLGPYAAEEIKECLKDDPDTEIYSYDGYGHVAFDTAPDYTERLFEFLTK